MFGKKKKEFVFEDEAGAEVQDAAGKSAPPKKADKKASSTRTLLLLLLLVVAGGGGYFFMMEEDAPPPPPAPVVQRQAIPIAKPAPPPAAEPAPTAAPAGEPATASAPPATTAPAPATVEPLPTAQPAVAAAPVASPPAEKASIQTTALAEPAPPTAPTATQAKVTPVASAGNFTLTTVAYADKGNVSTAQRVARNLGFQPSVTTVKHDTTMTRLRYGTFRPEEAAIRLLELKKVAPAAFTLRQGELISVYAGSFAVQDKARTFADVLYQKQILVSEEVVKVKVPLQQVKFGSFAERSAADQAAARARAAGLEVTVQARR